MCSDSDRFPWGDAKFGSAESKNDLKERRAARSSHF